MADEPKYLPCPVCNSNKLLHDGYSLDNSYIECINCGYSISGSDPYEMIHRWNNIKRK